ncbi:MAG: prepilin-type N-terminal cleavage/methylation domain-containing protein [Planctomycetota bacterium]
MSARSLKAQGFTLVEILIVVVILGILAAIVIPQFTSASESAKASSLVTQLQTLRSQLELWQIQHNGNYPTLDGTGDAKWHALTQYTAQTDTKSSDSASTKDSTNPLGTYLQKPPVNPFTGGSDVATGNSGDWDYTPATGVVRAVIPANKWAEMETLGLATSAEVTAGSNDDLLKGS